MGAKVYRYKGNRTKGEQIMRYQNELIDYKHHLEVLHRGNSECCDTCGVRVPVGTLAVKQVINCPINGTREICDDCLKGDK